MDIKKEWNACIAKFLDTIFGIDVQQALTPEVLGYKVNERFYSSLNDHWRDWCLVASERSALGAVPPDDQLAAFGAAVEKAHDLEDFTRLVNRSGEADAGAPMFTSQMK